MSISQDALRKTLMEMDSQLQRQRAELTMTDMSLQQKLTNLKINELIMNELNENKEKPIYKSCGKLFIKTNNDMFINDIKLEDNNNKDQINGLNKKKQYLETSLNVTYDNMKKYMGK